VSAIGVPRLLAIKSVTREDRAGLEPAQGGPDSDLAAVAAEEMRPLNPSTEAEERAERWAVNQATEQNPGRLEAKRRLAERRARGRAEYAARQSERRPAEDPAEAQRREAKRRRMIQRVQRNARWKDRAVIASIPIVVGFVAWRIVVVNRGQPMHLTFTEIIVPCILAFYALVWGLGRLKRRLTREAFARYETERNQIAKGDVLDESVARHHDRMARRLVEDAKNAKGSGSYIG
jgi:hypothetical protein